MSSDNLHKPAPPNDRNAIAHSPNFSQIPSHANLRNPVSDCIFRTQPKFVSETGFLATYQKGRSHIP
ncbi:hypothetical protein [Oscillatoria nigro-viridis]|uniref:hypothetical protein n=1 Tax=Phormidium nigroviride TaxID=482564 RepID=UPI0012372D95|nr:hypothetical protein [Oscillatoria nigro-viridis]